MVGALAEADDDGVAEEKVDEAGGRGPSRRTRMLRPGMPAVVSSTWQVMGSFPDILAGGEGEAEAGNLAVGA